MIEIIIENDIVAGVLFGFILIGLFTFIKTIVMFIYVTFFKS